MGQESGQEKNTDLNFKKKKIEKQNFKNFDF